MHRAFLQPSESLEPPMYICPLTPESGFSVLHEADQWLIWIIAGGVIDLHACSHFDEVLETLMSKEPQLLAAWEVTRKPEDFAAAWKRAIQEVATRFDASRTSESGVTERLKRQLLWAFDACGSLDADRFLTILAHEGAKLSEKQLIALVAEMMPGVNGTLRPRRTGGSGGGGDAAMN